MHAKHYPTEEIKDCNVIIDWKKLFDQLIENDFKHMITLGRLKLVKETITQMDIYWIKTILRNIKD